MVMIFCTCTCSCTNPSFLHRCLDSKPVQALYLLAPCFLPLSTLAYKKEGKFREKRNPYRRPLLARIYIRSLPPVSRRTYLLKYYGYAACNRRGEGRAMFGTLRRESPLSLDSNSLEALAGEIHPARAPTCHPLFSHDLVMASQLPSDEEIILLCKTTWSSYGRGLVKISESIFVKFGLDITPAEAATQKYAWEQVDSNVFRVPQPYRYFQDRSQGLELTIGYLVMEYIDGTSMSEYLKYATADEREATADAIVRLLNHLPTTPVSVTQGPGPVGCGPPRGYLWSEGGIGSSFASLTDMESWLNRLLMDYQPGYQGDLFNFTTSELSMCHTDLAPRNIILQPNGQLAVLDWGSAGFYPRVFETYAFRTCADREPIFTQVLSRLDEEHGEGQIQLLSKIERILLRFGDVINRYVSQDMPQKCTLLSSTLKDNIRFRASDGTKK